VVAFSIVTTSINIFRVRDPSALPSIAMNPYFKYYSTAPAYASTESSRHPGLSFRFKVRRSASLSRNDPMPLALE
jgi:hypothetical protein